MTDVVRGNFFERPVRLRVGDGVGRIMRVGEAIDWIETQWPQVKARFRDAESMLQRAEKTGKKDDIATARDAFTIALAVEGLLVE
jgi:hypothetical protein